MAKEWPVFDNPKNVKRFLVFFFVCLGMILLAGLFVDTGHAHFSWETKPFFYAAYGFVAYVSLIFIAKLLRLFLKRDEGYYSTPAQPTEAEEDKS